MPFEDEFSKDKANHMFQVCDGNHMAMGLLTLDMLHPKCQYQQATAFAMTAVIAKVEGSVGCGSLPLIFLMSSRKTGNLGVQCCYPKQIRGMGKRQILSKQYKKSLGKIGESNPPLAALLFSKDILHFMHQMYTLQTLYAPVSPCCRW